nr:hypothetical protein [Marinicella sp. W31]MDC2879450.1 hypothetical protein [Marinicella sp. W31]
MRRIVYAGVAASVIGVLSLQTAASAAELFDSGGTWNAVCDSHMTCRLTTSRMPANDGGLAIPSFVRADKANAPVAMVLPTINGIETLSRDGVFTISVDGQEVATIPVKNLRKDDAEGGYVTHDQTLVQPVLAAARVGRDEIMVSYLGPDDQEVATADLTGLHASLDWLDRQQGHGS